METNKHYFFVGLFIIGVVVATLCFTMWLTATGKGESRLFRVRFADSVSGLSVGGAVKFHGVDVGHVKSIIIDPADISLIQVEMQILSSTPVKEDTVASLKFQGVTGVVFIDLSGGSPEKANLAQTLPDDVIPEIRAARSGFDAIVDKLPQIIDKSSLILDQLQKMVSDQNVAELGSIIRQMNDMLKGSARNIQEITTHLNTTSRQADVLMRNLNALSESVKEKPSRLLFPDKEKGVPAP